METITKKYIPREFSEIKRSRKGQAEPNSIRFLLNIDIMGAYHPTLF